MHDVRLIAFYLPQFHPEPANDGHHGPGFTEWVHVAGARPLFRGHQQPVLPGELGFYDLRVPEVREAQAALARQYGISAFCWWHYWSLGRRLLERPFREVLESGEPDFPFCLGWANHGWATDRSGAPESIVVAQEYGGDDDHARHFAALEPAFHDPRYVRVGGAPLFYLFRPREVPDLPALVARWTKLAHRVRATGDPLRRPVARRGDQGGRDPVDGARRAGGAAHRRRRVPTAASVAHRRPAAPRPDSAAARCVRRG